MRIIVTLALLMALAACGGGGAESGTAIQHDPPPDVGPVVASMMVDSAGGTLAVTDASSPLAGTQVVVPAGALSSPTLITIAPVSGAGLPVNVVAARLGPSGIAFANPVTVTLPYSAQYLAANAITDPATLKVVAFNRNVANETLRTISQDTSQNTVTAQTTHSSDFGVVGYTLASLSGDYAMNFTMIDARDDAGVATLVPIPVDVPSVPYSTKLNVPFPAFAFRDEQGTVTFDGAGNYKWSAIRNVAGTSIGVHGDGTYTVSPDGSMGLDFGLQGSVLAGGSTFVLAATQGAAVIEMGMGVKKAGSFDVSSLQGSYAVALYYSDATAGPLNTIALDVPDMLPYQASLDVPFPGYALNSELRTMIFDGAGNYSWSGTRNTSGVSRPVSGSGTYTVAEDGALTIDTSLTGHMLAGASTFILTAPSGTVQMGAGIKKAGTFSAASLGGRYTVAYHYANATARAPDKISVSIPSTPYSSTANLPFPLYAFTSEVRSIVFDGSGRYTWTGMRDQGGQSVPGFGDGTYSVDTDGVLIMDGRTMGNVLDGGSTFILAPTSGQSTQIGVGLLR
jgi:hypothetical protein